MIKTELKIDPEFQALIPPLTDDERGGLEVSLKDEGCREKIIVWGDTIIDGHNRYDICIKHDIPFETLPKDFQTREEAMTWIIRNQFGRRNLTPYQRGALALRLEGFFKAQAKENLKTSTGGAEPRPLQKSANPAIDTRKEVAKIAKISPDTVRKVKLIEEKATPEQKGELRAGKKSVNKIWREINEAVNKYPRECAHVSWEPLPNGDKRCRQCGEIFIKETEKLKNGKNKKREKLPPLPEKFKEAYENLKWVLIEQRNAGWKELLRETAKEYLRVLYEMPDN